MGGWTDATHGTAAPERRWQVRKWEGAVRMDGRLGLSGEESQRRDRFEASAFVTLWTTSTDEIKSPPLGNAGAVTAGFQRRRRRSSAGLSRRRMTVSSLELPCAATHPAEGGGRLQDLPSRTPTTSAYAKRSPCADSAGRSRRITPRSCHVCGRLATLPRTKAMPFEGYRSL